MRELAQRPLADDFGDIAPTLEALLDPLLSDLGFALLKDTIGMRAHTGVPRTETSLAKDRLPDIGLEQTIRSVVSALWPALRGMPAL